MDTLNNGIFNLGSSDKEDELKIIKSKIGEEEKARLVSARKLKEYKEKLLSSETANVKKQLVERTKQEMAELQKQLKTKHGDELKALKKLISEKKRKQEEAEKSLARFKISVNKSVERAYLLSEENLYKSRSLHEKKEMLTSRKYSLDRYKEELDRQKALALASVENDADSEKKKKSILNKYNQFRKQREKEYLEIQKEEERVAQSVYNIALKTGDIDSRLSASKDNKEKYAAKLRELELAYEENKLTLSTDAERKKALDEYSQKRKEYQDKFIQSEQEYNELQSIQRNNLLDIEKRTARVTKLEEAQENVKRKRELLEEKTRKEADLKSRKASELSRATTAEEKEAIESKYKDDIDNSEKETNQANDALVKAEFSANLKKGIDRWS